MEMKTCESSQIAEHGFDPVTGTLAVRYKSGGLYHYDGVDASKYQQLCESESVGSFIYQEVKGKHGFKKIDEEKK